MSREKKQFLFSLLLAAVIVTFIGRGEEVLSQEKYPARAIEIIGPYSPGGTNDALARITADYLKKKWRVPINVVNKPGGNTIPANLELYRAAPDGYTVMCDQVEASIMLEVTEKNLPFKVFDRTWIGISLLGGMMFALPSTTPYKGFDDVVADIKRDPENFTWTSYGGMGAADTCFRSLFRAIGVDVRRTKPVACEGGAKCTALIAGGHVKMGSVGLSAASVGAMDAGTIRALAMVGTRYPSFPQLVSTSELGYPNVKFEGWIGFSGPPKMPSYIVDIWNKELREMTKDPEVISRFEKLKIPLIFRSSPQMQEQAARQVKELAELYPPAR